MSQLVNPLSLIPDSAPFDEDQRAWLNGFLAGWVGLQVDPRSPAANGAAGLLGNGTAPPAAAEEDEEFPWHDDTLPLDERMALAEGKPLKRKLMAAMAQLDCGSCGYLCRTYAEAIADGEEPSLKKCTPGGKETARKLKELVKLDPPGGAAASNGQTVNGQTVNGQATNGQVTNGAATNGHAGGSRWTRENPFPATLAEVRNLNREGSAKYTAHVEIDLTGGDDPPTYAVGDSLGVYPTNCDALVTDVIDALGATGDESVDPPSGGACTLRGALAERCCLAEVTDELLEMTIPLCTDPAADLLRRAVDDPDVIEGWDVLDLLRNTPSARPAAAEFVAALAALQPRLYSISSSPKAHPGRVHLTVGRVEWEAGPRRRKGVASTMFADRLRVGDPVRVFVQPSHGFTVPADPAAPAIMIGPGTGIAPFRAFLQERGATKSPGRNWLFFGDQRSTTDFLYEEELNRHRDEGVLHRLDTAFSRDQEAKVYVQNRMLEAGDELFRWLTEGASLYVCGDAKRMAADVDRALHQVIAERAGGEDAAKRFVQDLKQANRYCRDVY